jgi:glycosyltransferase involved in cell wall biosynthesis
MRILLDLQACQGSSTHRGIGRYSMALTLGMLRQGGQHDFRIVLNNRFPDSVATLRKTFDGLLPQSHISAYALPSHIWEHQVQNGWRLRAAEQVREHYLASLAPDVVHISSLFEGMGEDTCVSALHSRNSFDTAVTLYDLIPLVRKQTYLTDPNVANWYYRKLQSLKNAELLLAISGHSRLEAMEALQLPGERIANISSAVDTIFVPRTLAPDDAKALLARFGLHRGYIMYTGGIDFRKNIEGLIEAYAMLPGELRAQYQLAVVCSIGDAERMRLQALADSFNVPKGDLVLTGFVSDDDLVSLYNLTDLFVFPSLQEGFGLPALEAMSCGVPVIGSNNSSIPEVIGRADALFDPNKVADICAKMQQVLTTPAFAEELRAHGLEQCKLFSWDASARKALDAFGQVNERRQQQRRAFSAGGLAAPARRPRMAYVTPLPPERSGIADYSAELLPELARYYDIDVVVTQTAVEDRWLQANFMPRTVEWFDANRQRYDRVLYNFGNSSFHAHMFGLLQRHPGVVMLHDFFLSGAVNYLHSGTDGYRRALYSSHGYPALAHERAEGRDASYYRYPCNKAVLDNASGILVHSHHSQELAALWYGPQQARDWRMIPHLRVLPPALERDAARAALGMGEHDFLMCSFGLLAPTKYNDKIVEAWLASPLAQDERCHLVFVGENSVSDFGRALSARIRRHPRIKITGFASLELYRNYLMAADAAVQLRTRSRGETSGTVLDCLAYQVPAIINSHGSAAELPEHIVLKLPDQFSQEELSAAMLRLYEQAQRGVQYIATEHHPARIGEQYRDAIEHFAHHSPHARYEQLVQGLGHISYPVEPTEGDWLQVATSIAANTVPAGPRQLLVDVGALAEAGTPAPALLTALLTEGLDGWRVEPVLLREQRYHYARRYALQAIGCGLLELDDAVAAIYPGDCLLRVDGTQELDLALSNIGVQHAHLDCGMDDAGALPALAAALAALRAGVARSGMSLHSVAVPGAQQQAAPLARGTAEAPVVAESSSHAA